jgi:hypothetical protein
LSLGETHLSQSQSPTSLEVSHYTREAFLEIKETVERATTFRVGDDRLVYKIIEVGDRHHLTLEVLVRLIWDKTNEKRAQGKTVNPGLVLKMIQEDLVPWLKENANFVYQSRMREDEAAKLRRPPGKESLTLVNPAAKAQTQGS